MYLIKFHVIQFWHLASAMAQLPDTFHNFRDSTWKSLQIKDIYDRASLAQNSFILWFTVQVEADRNRNLDVSHDGRSVVKYPTQIKDN